MLAGRLGLERARIPHSDRHGLIWLERGRLEVEDGCLRFVTAGGSDLGAGSYQIPHQSVSMVLLGPGSSVTHDALRLLARHGCGLAAIGEGATRFYTARHSRLTLQRWRGRKSGFGRILKAGWKWRARCMRSDW